MIDGYRVLHVQSVTYAEKYMDVKFKDCVVNFAFDRYTSAFVEKLWENIFPGSILLIKGRTGNEDHDFWGFNTIEDIKVVI